MKTMGNNITLSNNNLKPSNSKSILNVCVCIDPFFFALTLLRSEKRQQTSHNQRGDLSKVASLSKNNDNKQTQKISDPSLVAL